MNGFLNIDKPKGFTSHDVVDVIRRRFRPPRVGHLGTLDPLARGVLPLALGKSTKLSEKLLQKDKEYEGTIFLGIQTDTQDIEGKVAFLNAIPPITNAHLEEFLSKFRGEQEQLTPMFSARRHKGKRLFELARKGQVVERRLRKIKVFKFENLMLEPPYIHFFVHCSKGTYIRTLAHDLGRMIGCGACLFDLVRLRNGPFVFSESVSLNSLTNLDSLRKHIVPEEKILAGLN
ncbi:MAG: tRNA pseudouridine(55) synthase TruB [Candidatus Ratteibacteria bacterium]|nr:tRNA pseudouridine(55) synthase TruB [Candidatus Ratteibacteria bacterium]